MKSLLKTTLIVSLIFGFHSNLKAQNSENITNDWKAMVENILPNFLNAGANQFEGLAISFVYGDSSWTTSVGQANDTGLAIDPNGKWLFRSYTKLMVSTIILQLYEEGQLDIADSISEYLDPITNVNMSDTIDDLLQMRSRMCAYINSTNSVVDKIDQDRSAVLDTKTMLVEHLPSGACNEEKAYDYNDANFQVLGLIIEAVTGKSGEEVFSERIIEPYSLVSTALAPLDLERNQFNGLYRSVKDAEEKITTTDDSMESLNSLLTSQKFNGGIMGSTSDMINFTKALLDGNVLGDTTLNLMKADSETDGYGKGLMIQEMKGELGIFSFDFPEIYPGNYFGHGGAAWNTSRTFYDPEREIGFSFAFNSSTPSFDAVFNTEKFKENMYRLIRKCFEEGGCEKPAKPETSNLFMPENSSILELSILEFSWNQSNRARSYNFELSTQEDFNTVLYDSSLTDTSLTLDEKFDNNTQYFWRVKAIGDGGESEWSPIWSFITKESVPTSSILLLPGDSSEVSTLSPEFKWKQSDRANEYHFNLSSFQDFSSILFDSTLTDTSLMLSEKLANGSDYYWRVKAIGDGGESEWSETFSYNIPVGVFNQLNETPTEYSISQNYPNPFNPSTNISFELPEAGLVQLKVHNLLGQEVANLVDGRMNSGNHTVNFDASQLSSGVYIYRLVAGNQSITKKMMLIK